MASLDHPTETLAPRYPSATKHLVHVSDIGPERRVRLWRVFEGGFDPDQLAHVGAVILYADGLTSRPIDYNGWDGGDLHGPDPKIYIVVLVDGVVVVGLVRMQPDGPSLQHHLEP